MASRKNAFYVVTVHTVYSDSETQMVISRTELISFLRSGCKFLHIRPLERFDFSNPELFETEANDEQH